MSLFDQPGPAETRLQDLVVKISYGDRDAFTALFDGTSPAVREHLWSRTNDPEWVTRVVIATYVEVWWLAGCHTSQDEDTMSWITQIADRRFPELRPAAPRVVPDQRARYSALELADLLGRPIESTFDAGSLHLRRRGPISSV